MPAVISIPPLPMKAYRDICTRMCISIPAIQPISCKLLSFPGYSEGWASYVERESYTMDNGLKPEMGQLLAANSSASLGFTPALIFILIIRAGPRIRYGII